MGMKRLHQQERESAKTKKGSKKESPEPRRLKRKKKQSTEYSHPH